jgi:hypothetical protein
MMLSLSSIFITQIDAHSFAYLPGYSRYVAIYSLRSNPLRNPLACKNIETIISNRDLSYRQNPNWICDHHN